MVDCRGVWQLVPRGDGCVVIGATEEGETEEGETEEDFGLDTSPRRVVYSNPACRVAATAPVSRSGTCTLNQSGDIRALVTILPSLRYKNEYCLFGFHKEKQLWQRW